MTRIPLALFTASALILIAQGAKATSLDLATGAINESAGASSLVLQAHGCHKLCQHGPYGSPAPHRHRFGSCAPTHFPCLDWGWLRPQQPVFYERRHPN